MNRSLNTLIIPLFALAPALFACGGTDDDDELVSEGSSLALASDDPAVGDSTEDADGAVSGGDMAQATDDAVDSAADATPGEGFVTCDFGALKRQILSRFDANGDGRLDADERAELRDAIDDHPRARLAIHRLLGDRRPHFHVWARVRWAFDVNGDGTLSHEERAALVAAMEERCERRKASFIEKYDSNGDGSLSRDELLAAVAAVRQAFAEKRAAFMAKYDTNGDGTLDDAERAVVRADIEARRDALRARVLAAFDANGNGVLDPDEIDALKAEIRRRVAEGA